MVLILAVSKSINMKETFTWEDNGSISIVVLKNTMKIIEKY